MHSALLVVVLGFALLGHGYFWIGVVNRLHGLSGPHRIIDYLTRAFLFLFLALPFTVVWQVSKHGSGVLMERSLPVWSVLTNNYVLSMAFVGLGNLLAVLVSESRVNDPKVVVGMTSQLVEISNLSEHECLRGPYSRLLGWIPGNQVLQLAVESKGLAIPSLPEALVGFRIVHISDLHMTGRVGLNWFQHVVDNVNRLAADVIAITGDLIEDEACRPWLAETFGRLHAAYGVYFILGNHDFYIDANQTISDLTAMNLDYVGGKSVFAFWNGYPVLIEGNESPWREHRLVVPEMATWSPRPFRVQLLHSPDQFDMACSSSANLALAGHTHGGQVCFPLLGAVASPSLYGTRFAGGTFIRGSTVMHVTRGISGETPFRMLCPPEIAVLELCRAAV